MINEILNLLFVSFPEEIIWILTSFVLLKRFDLLDKYRWKENAKWFIIPAFLCALIINTLRYINTPRLIISITAILSIYLSIIIILKLPKINILNEKVLYIKTFLFVLLAAIIIILIESLYAPFLIAYIEKSIIEVNNIWSVNFVLSIPTRITQIISVLIILTIQNKDTYTNILQSILYEKKISLTIMSFTIIMIFFWIVLIDVFGNLNIISQFSLGYKILLNILIFIVPLILLSLMIYLVILFVDKINQMRQSHQNMFDDDYINS